jgi:hypothetical protein
VAGSGRSGTSVFSGILKQLGFYVPQPEVEVDDTNPRGFGEPQWVVDYHTRLLRQAGVQVSDARPDAWFRTGKASIQRSAQSELRDWMAEQFRISDDVIIKDPRLAWFLPLWRRCALDLRARPVFVTLLRHPAEVLDSKQRWYGTWQPDATRAAGWINLMLYTERATRDAPRAFVRYDELLGDWARTVGRVGEALDLSVIRNCSPTAMRRVYQFVDPDLHRSKVGWGDLQVPQRVRTLAEEVWEKLNQLAEKDGVEVARLGSELDEARSTYIALYQEAASIAWSSIQAARQKNGGNMPQASNASGVHRILRHVPRRYRQRIPIGVRQKVLKLFISRVRR